MYIHPRWRYNYASLAKFSVSYPYLPGFKPLYTGRYVPKCCRRLCRRAACGAMPPCPGGARGHDGLRVAGACVLGSRRGDECRGADQSGHRVAAGNRLAVSGASVSARLTPCRRGGSDICGRDMKMAATVFQWRPSWRVFACCRLYAFLSARRS